MERIKQITVAALAASALCVIAPTPFAALVDPPIEDALRAGYTVNTLSATFTNATVDMHNSGQKGYAWYPWNFFGRHAKTDRVVLNKDGSVTLQGDDADANGELASAAPTKGPGSFVGTAFGGGAYIEGILKFDPTTVAAAKMKGWPAFWSMAAEHLTQGNEQWDGKPSGFAHFIELDFFEYDLLPVPNVYGANLHEWYGAPKTTCPGYTFCDAHLTYSETKRPVPNRTNFRDYHRYGCLWVPATEAHPGYTRFYFDGGQVGIETSWTTFKGQGEAPTGQPWRFGILDAQHLVLILGSGPSEPMTIRSVKVWQSRANHNVQQ